MLETLSNNGVVSLFAVITAGLLLGCINLAGLTPRSSGVIFAALTERNAVRADGYGAAADSW